MAIGKLAAAAREAHGERAPGETSSLAQKEVDVKLAIFCAAVTGLLANRVMPADEVARKALEVVEEARKVRE